jgi:hypothetical protein
VRRDGSSFERAFLMDQWRWQARYCPGAQLLFQGLASRGSRRYDILRLALPSGEERVVYFDLTAMFNKTKDE